MIDGSHVSMPGGSALLCVSYAGCVPCGLAAAFPSALIVAACVPSGFAPVVTFAVRGAPVAVNPDVGHKGAGDPDEADAGFDGAPVGVVPDTKSIVTGDPDEADFRCGSPVAFKPDAVVKETGDPDHVATRLNGFPVAGLDVVARDAGLDVNVAGFLFGAPFAVDPVAVGAAVSGNVNISGPGLQISPARRDEGVAIPVGVFPNVAFPHALSVEALNNGAVWHRVAVFPNVIDVGRVVVVGGAGSSSRAFVQIVAPKLGFCGTGEAEESDQNEVSFHGGLLS